MKEHDKSDLIKRYKHPSIVAILSMLIIGWGFYVYPQCVSLPNLLSLNTSMRGIIALFTGMLGTMVSLVFSGNIDVLLKKISDRDNLKSIKNMIFMSFGLALLFLVYSILIEILFSVFQLKGYLFLSSVFIVFFGILSLFIVSISQTVYEVLDLALISLNKKLKK